MCSYCSSLFQLDWAITKASRVLSKFRNLSFSFVTLTIRFRTIKSTGKWSHWSMVCFNLNHHRPLTLDLFAEFESSDAQSQVVWNNPWVLWSFIFITQFRNLQRIQSIFWGKISLCGLISELKRKYMPESSLRKVQNIVPKLHLQFLSYRPLT